MSYRLGIDRRRIAAEFAAFAMGLLPILGTSSAEPSFVNWETAPVHPIDLSPNGKQLAVANLPAAQLEIIDVTSQDLQQVARIPVGLDPVTARYYSPEQVWVVCHISDSINVIDIPSQRVVDVIQTADGPSDVIFGGTPLRAYVSCTFENTVLVIDPVSHEILNSIPIQGQRPKSLAKSLDGSQVYVAIFESGNASTILAPRIGLDFVPGSVVDLHEGPYQGQNPPPNKGEHFAPPISAHLTQAPPRVGLIVKKNQAGQWMDDNEQDWSDYVSGPLAPLSGRPIGWDMPDRDLAVIHTHDHSVEYVSNLMNICMNVSVHPLSGEVYVVGTDGKNEVRFEPNLNGRFLDVNLARINPSDFTSKVSNLNRHLDGQVAPLPPEKKQVSIGDPRHLTWDRDGSFGYIAGMGSDNLIKIAPDGNRIETAPILLEGGPSALAIDSERRRLFVYQRFTSRLSVLDTETDDLLNSIQLFDPTPEPIRKGRPHFYNTQRTSGTGHLSCASCHVDGRFDRLAWDLGTPEGPSIPVDRTLSFEDEFIPDTAHPFHPMKGPMVTMTMQDIIGHEPFHWRGDRRSIEEFNPTFTDLQAAERELTHVEMAEFKDFLSTLHFPPNRYRTLSNGLSKHVPIQDHHALGRDGGGRQAGMPFAFGDAIRGQSIFVHTTECTECHTQSTGLGPHLRFRDRRWQEIPDGPLGERHVSLVQQPRSNDLPFKIASLRGLSEKVGADFFNLESSVGFGFGHSGAVDSLVRFIQDGFNVVEDRTTTDLVAFLLSFTGAESSLGRINSREDPPGLISRDTHAAVGRQFLLQAGDEIPGELNEALDNAMRSRDSVDLIVYQQQSLNTLPWVFSKETGLFHPDSADDPVEVSSLVNDSHPGTSLLFTVVPPGSGQRMAHDWDLDGVSNQDELEDGFNPYDARSTPINLAPRMAPIIAVALGPDEVLDIQIEFEDPNIPPDPVELRLLGESPATASLTAGGHLTWTPPSVVQPRFWQFEIEAQDSGSPPMKSHQSFLVYVLDTGDRPGASAMQVLPDEVIIRWKVIPGQPFQISHSSSLSPPLWFPLTPPVTTDQTTWETRHARTGEQSQLYRIENLSHLIAP